MCFCFSRFTSPKKVTHRINQQKLFPSFPSTILLPHPNWHTPFYGSRARYSLCGLARWDWARDMSCGFSFNLFRWQVVGSNLIECVFVVSPLFMTITRKQHTERSGDELRLNGRDRGITNQTTDRWCGCGADRIINQCISFRGRGTDRPSPMRCSIFVHIDAGFQ